MITRREVVTAVSALGMLALGKQNSEAQIVANKLFLYCGLSWDHKGEGTVTPLKQWKCKKPNTPNGVIDMATYDVQLFLPYQTTDCDEIKCDGFFRARWRVVLRADFSTAGTQLFFGTHHGKFQLQDQCGNYAEGTMDGTVGCGSHRDPLDPAHPPCERCREPHHFEGYLRGRYLQGPMTQRKCTLEAIYSGHFNEDFKWPPIGAVTSPIVRMNTDGVYICRCD